MNARLSRCLPLFALALGACDSQVDGDYNGEVLVRLTGTITSELQSPPAQAEAMLFWIADKGDGDYVVGEAVAVAGNFPTGFTLELYLPPPDAALIDLPDGNRAGLALIGVADPDVTDEDIEQGTGVYGLAEHHALIYVESPVGAGSELHEWLGVTLDAGYHVMDVVPAQAGETFDTMVPAGGDDPEIGIRLVDDLGELDIPNLG